MKDGEGRLICSRGNEVRQIMPQGGPKDPTDIEARALLLRSGPNGKSPRHLGPGQRTTPPRYISGKRQQNFTQDPWIRVYPSMKGPSHMIMNPFLRALRSPIAGPPLAPLFPNPADASGTVPRTSGPIPYPSPGSRILARVTRRS